MTWKWTAAAVGALAVSAWWGYSRHQEASRLDAALRAERSLTTIRDVTASALLDAERLLQANRAAVGAAQAMARAAVEAAAEGEISKAAAEARDVDDEFKRTGRVTESLRRAYRDFGKSR